ncbi:DoxX family protein [Corynebacterium suedekumii]|uniref:DoxX family protein n=1 Tax=Corynebacterium suedekumii TaxID=3049801 RepID=A0ABY8VJQ2_9CORY|nr:DoxX family protein [Corynebacterium suedekumii]WIM69216.1 DoxX family protein [Corynebacterium suedekumii]
MDKPAVRDAALLLLRLVLGIVFVAHGWDKLLITGLTETTGQFSAWGVPQPKLSAYLVMAGELLGGALLVVGLLTTFVAGALALLMAAAVWFVHLGNGLFAADGGVELPAVLIVALLMIVVFGAGRASLDGVLTRG